MYLFVYIQTYYVTSRYFDLSSQFFSWKEKNEWENRWIALGFIRIFAVTFQMGSKKSLERNEIISMWSLQKWQKENENGFNIFAILFEARLFHLKSLIFVFKNNSNEVIFPSYRVELLFSLVSIFNRYFY